MEYKCEIPVEGSEKRIISKLLRLPIPKMGFVPRKFNISANKIAIYAITVCG